MQIQSHSQANIDYIVLNRYRTKTELNEAQSQLNIFCATKFVVCTAYINLPRNVCLMDTTDVEIRHSSGFRVVDLKDMLN
jgi:hypothetical protein